jgi:16S rRNA processing protein RimM
MEFEGYYRLGTIVKTHGIKGEVVIKLDVDDPSGYKKTKAVFLEKDGLLFSVTVLSASLNGEMLRVGLEGYPDMTVSESLVKKNVFLPLNSLPKLKGKSIYFHEAVGMLVVDSVEGTLGPITKIYDMPEQPVAAVALGEKELLFPFLNVFIDRIDRENKTIFVSLPQGLTDIYR